jgi:hypothetical protein
MSTAGAAAALAAAERSGVMDKLRGVAGAEYCSCASAHN